MKIIRHSFVIPVGFLLLSVTGASVQANPSTARTRKKGAPSSSQTIRLKAFLAKYDLSPLWTTTESSSIFGFIGGGYQRLQIHLVSVTRDRNDAAMYMVEGKTLVRNRIRRFTGIIVAESVVVLPQEDYAKEDGLTEGEISGRYLFKENPMQEATGVFEGKLKTDYYTDKHGAIHYDDLMIDADGYSNNEFVGTWKSYRGTVAKKCNWGDYRAPDSGDLDIGVGEFYPNEKYVKNGWQPFVAEWKKTEWKEGKAKENEWWKWARC